MYIPAKKTSPVTKTGDFSADFSSKSIPFTVAIAGIAAMIAAAIALNILFITQRRRKQRQGKELITYVLGKLFAGRNGAEAIAGHHHFHF